MPLLLKLIIVATKVLTTFCHCSVRNIKQTKFSISFQSPLDMDITPLGYAYYNYNYVPTRGCRGHGKFRTGSQDHGNIIAAANMAENIFKTGSAYYATSSAVCEMLESIVKDKKRILPGAAYLTGQFGYNDMFMNESNYLIRTLVQRKIVQSNHVF